MSSRRLASVLGPVIVLVLIGGITAAVLRGPGGSDETDLASEPTETAEPSEFAEPTDPAEPTEFADPTESAAPGDTVPPTAGEADPLQTPAQTDDGSQAGGPTQDPTDPPTPEPVPSTDPVGSEVAVQDPAELTGGWEGGTPNTGTAVSAAGLLLLVIAGGLLWLRRSRA